MQLERGFEDQIWGYILSPHHNLDPEEEEECSATAECSGYVPHETFTQAMH